MNACEFEALWSAMMQLERQLLTSYRYGFSRDDYIPENRVQVAFHCHLW